MTTITLWLLVSLGYPAYNGRATTLVERFATSAECERVRAVIAPHGHYACIQATVMRP